MAWQEWLTWPFTLLRRLGCLTLHRRWWVRYERYLDEYTICRRCGWDV